MTQADNTQLALNQKRISWTDLLVEANEIADPYEQDFDNEITYFEYGDGSVAAFHSMTQEIYIYGCKN